MNNTNHITEFPDDANYTLTGAQLNLLLARYHNVAINMFARLFNSVFAYSCYPSHCDVGYWKMEKIDYGRN